MKNILSAFLLVIGMFASAPSVAQTIEIGPGGPNVDLRSRGQRERDMNREDARRDDRREMRREMRRRDTEEDEAPAPRRRY